MTTRYTNKLNLPSVIVRAVTNDTYKRGGADFTVTQLLRPPRVSILSRLHANEITEDVSDVIYRMMGSIGHGIIERAGGDTGDIIENRFQASFEVDGKTYTVSGQADLVRENADSPFSIYDWKFTSIYAFKDGVKPEYVAQLNMLKLLAKREQGLEIQSLFSAPVYRDWSKGMAKRSETYPQQQVQLFQVAEWTEAETESFIAARIREHVAAETVLPECSQEDRWADPTTYAVVKTGGVRALPGGVFTVEADAIAFAQTKGAVVQTRHATSKRCEDWCSAAPHCGQWQQLKASMEAEAV